MKNEYTAPNMEIISVAFDDVITTSVELPNDEHAGDNEVTLNM